MTTYISRQIVREYIPSNGMGLLEDVIDRDTPEGVVEVEELYMYCGWVLTGGALPFGVHPTGGYNSLVEYLCTTYTTSQLGIDINK